MVAETTNTSGDPIRVGIVGLGLAGRSASQEIVKSPFVHLEAVCDLNETTAVQVASAMGARAYTEFEHMCSDPAIEAIFVSTPTHLRLRHIAMAVEHGKHVMSEKPLARNSDDARKIAEQVAATDCVLTAVNTRGRDAVVQAMAKLVGSSKYGTVLGVTNVMYKPWLLSPRYDYEMDPDLGGGVNFRQAPHQVEIARTIIDDEVSSVSATVGHVDSPVAAYGNFNALIRFRSGAAASLIFNGYGYFDTSELTWGVGEGGRERVPGENIERRRRESWKQVKYAASPPVRPSQDNGPTSRRLAIYGLTIVSCEYADLRPSPTGVLVYDYDSIHEVPVAPSDGGVQEDFREFFRAVREGEPCIHDVSWGVTTVDICEAIWSSAQTDTVVRF